MRRTPVLLAALIAPLALTACDWPVPDRDDPAAAGPWPALVPDAALGLGAAAPSGADDPPDLAARAAALRARAAALDGTAGIDAATAARIDAAGG